MSGRRPAAFVTAVLAATFAAGCAPRGAVTWPVPSFDPGRIRIGSFDFPESALLAQLYGQAVEAKGHPVTYYLNLGSREIVEPALEQGYLDMVPEYLGSALSFVTAGRRTATGSMTENRAALAQALASRGLAALAPARAEDANTVVVTARTAAVDHLLAVSDLRPYASTMVFGAPPECLVRDLCLHGLERVYGLSFKDSRPLDPAGTYVIQALRSNAIQVGILFSTDPRLDPDRQRKLKRIVPLRDDRGLQPHENVVPVLRREAEARFGPAVTAALDDVSARLTTEVLTDLVAEVTLDHRSLEDVAAEWLREEGLL